jgi:hypothetical protein
MKRPTLTGAAAVLLLVSAWGLWRGAHAVPCQVLYHQAKYGAAEHDVDGILDRCERAFALYPHNYYFLIWAAEAAYYDRFDEEGVERPERVAAAELWCRRGLEATVYSSQLRMLKTRLIERKSLADAILYWEEYVRWHFWSPYNHAVLVELYAKAGRLTDAVASLKWTERSEYHAEARRHLREAWAREREPPDLPGG